MMKFEVDNQTLNDLSILSEWKSNNSIFNFYNNTKTKGGEEFLLELMKSPLTDIKKLTERIELIRFLSSMKFELDINSRQFGFIEHYLQLSAQPLKSNPIDALVQNLTYRLKPNNDYYLIQSGVQQLKFLFNSIKKWIITLKKYNAPQILVNQITSLEKIVYNNNLADLNKKEKLTFFHLNKLDYMLRKKYKGEIEDIIKIIYKLDAFISIGKVATQKNLAFPEYNESPKPTVLIKGLFHPFLSNPVPYDFQLPESNNVCFLTGPNMVGKSTFLKTLGLAIYISHLGLPVPASDMKTSVFQGIITTINLPDNIHKGYSHFYSEVMRVKEVALKLKERKRLFIIFDELFRGTNLKDAFDASLVVINLFSKINQSTFCISTHITEIAEKLDKTANIQFKYFDFELIDNKPVYTYKLKSGISHERLGMYIVENEKIVEILRSVHNK